MDTASHLASGSSEAGQVWPLNQAWCWFGPSLRSITFLVTSLALAAARRAASYWGMDTQLLLNVLGAATASSSRDLPGPDGAIEELDTVFLRSEAPWVFRYLGADELNIALEIWESSELPAELTASALQSATLNMEAMEICRQALEQLTQIMPTSSVTQNQRDGKGKGKGKEREKGKQERGDSSACTHDANASSSSQASRFSGTPKTRSPKGSSGTASDTWSSVLTPESNGSATSLESVRVESHKAGVRGDVDVVEAAGDAKRKNWAKARIGKILKLRSTKSPTVDLAASAVVPAAPVLPLLPFQEDRGNIAAVAVTSDRPLSSGKQGSQHSSTIGGSRSGSKVARNIAKIAKLPQLRSPDTTVECAGCLDDIPQKKGIPLRCKHHYCVDCFGQMIISASQNEVQWPPRCCLSEVPRKLIIRHLESDRLKMFHDKEREYAVKASDRFYCTNVPDCGKFFVPERKGQETATCSHCSYIMCTACRGAAHAPGERCRHDRELQATLDRAALEGWRVCSNCHAIVEHNRGCQHMTCRCGYNFCYVCNAVWNTCSCGPADLEAYLERNRTSTRATATTVTATAAPVAAIPVPRGTLRRWVRARNRAGIRAVDRVDRQAQDGGQRQPYDRAPTPIPPENLDMERQRELLARQERQRQAAIAELARARELQEAQEQRELEEALEAIAEQHQQDMADRRREEEAEAERIEAARVAAIEEFQRRLDQSISQYFADTLIAIMSRRQQQVGAVESVRTEVQRLELAAREDAETRRMLRNGQVDEMRRRHARHMAEFKKRIHRDIISEAEKRRTQPADSIDPEFTLALFDKAEGRFASLAETQQREVDFLGRSHARSFIRAQIAGRTQVMNLLRGVGIEWKEEDNGKEASGEGIGQYADTELYQSANSLVTKSLTREAVSTVADLKWLQLLQRLANGLVLDKTAQLMLSGADAPVMDFEPVGGWMGAFATLTAAEDAAEAEEAWRGGIRSDETILGLLAVEVDDWPLRRPGWVPPAQ